MITIHYKRNEKTLCRMDSCTDFECVFLGKSLNEMPEATELKLLFNIEDGVEDTLRDLTEMMGKERFKKPIEFRFKIKDGNVEDTFEFLGTPVLYRMVDTSKPETEMTLAVRNDDE